LKESDYLEAFSHHPKIGANLAELARKFPNTAQLSAAEQRGVSEASEGTLQALSELNLAYEQRFGFIFIVCAKGKTASEMRHLLERRINNPKPVELELAAVEQGKITRLRLEQLGT
jgi:2-oxo-4-hydroxy-4-carboxy-5-ureidoimidazoline decarboxylase